MNAGLSIEQRDRLQAELRALSDTMPPRVVWERIAEQGMAEGLISSGPGRRVWSWLAGGAIAAAAALFAVNFAGVNRDDAVLPQTQVTRSDAHRQMVNLDDLMHRSQQLERELRLLPSQPRVVRAGTAATISELEDRIAAIDYRLSHPAVRLSRAEAEIYWRERVRLMNLLYNVRYAQVQRAVY